MATGSVRSTMKTRKLIHVSLTYPGIEPLLFTLTWAHSSVTKKLVMHSSHSPKVTMENISSPRYHDDVREAVNQAFPWDHPQCLAYAQERGMVTPYTQSGILHQLEHCPRKATCYMERTWEC